MTIWDHTGYQLREGTNTSRAPTVRGYQCSKGANSVEVPMQQKCQQHGGTNAAKVPTVWRHHCGVGTNCVEVPMPCGYQLCRGANAPLVPPCHWCLYRIGTNLTHSESRALELLIYYIATPSTCNLGLLFCFLLNVKFRRHGFMS